MERDGQLCNMELAQRMDADKPEKMEKGVDGEGKKKEGKEEEGDEDRFPNELFKRICTMKRFHLHESRADVQAIKELVGQEAFQKKEVLNAKNSKGETALFCAVALRQFHVARVLVEAGADACEPEDRSAVELVFYGTDGVLGGSAVSFARWLCGTLAKQGKGDAMRRIFNTKPIGAFLCSEKEGGQEDALRILLEHGMDANLRFDGMSLLECAVWRDHTAMAQMLIDKGADVNALGMHGLTALHTAALKGNDDMALMLLKHGASDSIRCGDMPEASFIDRCTPSQVAYMNARASTGMLIKKWSLWHVARRGSRGG
jgi:hypothetical protein